MSDEPPATSVTTTVVPNDRGTEDVLIQAAGEQGMLLAAGIDAALERALATQIRNPRFSGRLQVVVLADTPIAERRHVVPVIERARQLCAELSTGTEPYRVTLAYEGKPSLNAAPVALGATSSGSGSDVAPRRTAGMWIGAGVVIVALLGAAGWYVFAGPLPRSVDFGRVRMRRASQWTRDGVSGGFYLYPGDSLGDATVRLTVLSSTSRATVPALDAWTRSEYSRLPGKTLYDADTFSEACRIDAPAAPSPSALAIRLQTCRAGGGRAVCVELAEPLRQEVATTCQESATTEGRAACFSDTCTQRRQARAGALTALVSDLLGE